MNLPSHIVKRNDKWYHNTKTGKYIHCDRIEAFLERYWRNRSGTKKEAVKYRKNIKMAQRRWNDE